MLDRLPPCPEPNELLVRSQDVRLGILYLITEVNSRWLRSHAPAARGRPACAASARCGSRLTGLVGQLGLTRDGVGFTHSQAIAGITGGNFQLLHRLFARIERILRTSDLTVVTSEVIEAARSTLVIGDAA